jgi:hypothetical protein
MDINGISQTVQSAGIILTAGTVVLKLIMSALKDFHILKGEKLKKAEAITKKIEDYALKAVRITQQHFKGNEEIKTDMKEFAVDQLLQLVAADPDTTIDMQTADNEIEAAVNVINAERDSGALRIKRKK